MVQYLSSLQPIDNDPIDLSQMDNELYDITPCSHNNYKTPLVSKDISVIYLSVSQKPNLSKPISRKKAEENINKNEAVSGSLLILEALIRPSLKQMAKYLT